MDLPIKYRPKKLSEVVGQPEAVRVLREYLRSNTLPHTMMFVGPSGTGKTTLAGILADKLCGKDPWSYFEVDCAMQDPKATVDRIGEQCNYSRDGQKPLVYVYDEYQSWSRSNFAQQGCLKLFESDRKNAYHFLCTTDPQKIIPTVRNRCEEVKTRLLSDEEIVGLVSSVAARESAVISEEAKGRIAELSMGSARRALVLLGRVVVVPVKQQMGALGKGDDCTGDAIELPRVLVKPGVRWKEVAEVLKRLRSEDAERLRRLVTAYCASVILGGGRLAVRAMVVLQAFREPVFVGFDDVVAMAWDAVHAS